MRAIVFDRFGEPADVLKLADVPIGEPGDGEIRVRMSASPVNPSDLMVVRGRYGSLPTLPAVPGFEGVGIVECAGRGFVGRYLVGKRVAVLNGRTGNWCDATVIPARQAVPLPKSLSMEQGAMFFVNPATAYLLTRKILDIPRGEWLLQTAAGSAVGKMVIRLGRRFGFRTLNVVRRTDQIDELKALGADAVIVFEPRVHSAEHLRDDVSKITGDALVRFAIDPVAGPTAAAAAECLGENGRLVVYGTLSNESIVLEPRTLITQNARVEGFWLGRTMMRQGIVAKIRLIRTISRLIREGVLAAEVAESFPLDRIADAVRAAESPGRRGKILLQIAHPDGPV